MKHLFHTLLAITVLSMPSVALADRIKDIAQVAAVRSNQLIGYGLVVGLQGTGDGADVSFTAQSMKAMLSRLGVSLEGPLSDFEQGGSGGKIDIKNVAAVMITAELPGLAKPGQKNRHQRLGHRQSHQLAWRQFVAYQLARCGWRNLRLGPRRVDGHGR